MAKCSTIMYVNDSLDYSGLKIVEIDKILEDIDASLDEFFKGIEINVSSELVSKTLALVEK
jgi:hypothetical protein